MAIQFKVLVLISDRANNFSLSPRQTCDPPSGDRGGVFPRGEFKVA